MPKPAIQPFLGLPSFNFRAMIDQPTCTDVLLGRGVATNRHPGNENFRAIVAKQVVSSAADDETYDPADL